MGYRIGKFYLHRFPVKDDFDIRYTLAFGIFVSLFVSILIRTQKRNKMCSSTAYAYFFASGWGLLSCLLAVQHSPGISVIISILVMITAYKTAWYFEGFIEIEAGIIESGEKRGVDRGVVEKELFPYGIFLKNVMESARIDKVKKWRKIILIWMLFEQFLWLVLDVLYTMWFENWI